MTLWFLFLCVNGGAIQCSCWSTLVVFLSMFEVLLSTSTTSNPPSPPMSATTIPPRVHAGAYEPARISELGSILMARICCSTFGAAGGASATLEGRTMRGDSVLFELDPRRF
ncbi:hypothetical protein LR48_Vigan03g086100 [Vigna angularis]|uniref:Uncharacterized protein n=1 Tax=Phaseolus angularis TaxID=3914 RepID=A0A0L9U522_PHAAN|nr:hypothetical protein LR48_Vigan03g086100 [Vigna angularis]